MSSIPLYILSALPENRDEIRVRVSRPIRPTPILRPNQDLGGRKRAASAAPAGRALRDPKRGLRERAGRGRDARSARSSAPVGRDSACDEWPLQGAFGRHPSKADRQDIAGDTPSPGSAQAAEKPNRCHNPQQADCARLRQDGDEGRVTPIEQCRTYRGPWAGARRDRPPACFCRQNQPKPMVG